MNFLSPTALFIAAALTVPPLVLLYFLKLRRREVPISSTFFWKRAVQDLQVNAPFQKIRRNLLLLLQLLVLLAACLALGRPLLRQEDLGGQSLILLIDRSASMNVVEPDERTRLERARGEALKLIEEVGDEFDRGMVIAFSSRAKMMAPFTSNRGTLERAIEAVTPGDGLSSLAEAVALASAHAQSELVGRDAPPGSPVSTAPPAKIVLLSDGRIEDAATVTSERMEMELINVGVSDDNAGVVSLSSGRYYERPERLNVIAAVKNCGPAAIELDVELLVGGQLRDIQTVSLPPGIAPADGSPHDPAAAQQVVSFDDVDFPERGIIEVRLARQDKLAADNRAFAAVPPPRRVKVLVVAPDNRGLVSVLAALPVDLTVMTPPQYESADEDELTEAGRSRFGVVVFDDCSSARLPTGSYLFFGRVPQVEGFAQGEEVKFDPIFNWNDTHPVMRHVNPENIYVFQYRRLTLPSGAESLIDAQQGSILSTVGHHNSRFLICAFSVMDDRRRSWNSTWPLRTHFVVFMWNAVQYLSGSFDVDIQVGLRPGDALTIDSPADAVLTVERPDGHTDKVPVGSSQVAHYGRTDRVGVYTVYPTADERTQFAVNLFSENESHIQPNADFAIGGEAVESRTSVQPTNVPLWPWLLLAALGFLFLEWAVYSRRILV